MLTLRTQSFCRYRVHGGVPSPWGEEFHRLLTERRFLPLRGDEERAHGWVSADNLLITQFHAGTVMRGEYAAFALRIDKRRINARLLRAQLDLEVQARLKGLRDGGEKARLGRDERRELREQLRQELMRQTTPSIDQVQVLLHAKHKIALVLSMSRPANDLVRVHFRDTFEADLEPLSPWRRSVELLEADARGGTDLRAGLGDLRRTDFSRLHVPAAAPREVRL